MCTLQTIAHTLPFRMLTIVSTLSTWHTLPVPLATFVAINRIAYTNIVTLLPPAKTILVYIFKGGAGQATGNGRGVVITGLTHSHTKRIYKQELILTGIFLRAPLITPYVLLFFCTVSLVHILIVCGRAIGGMLFLVLTGGVFNNIYFVINVIIHIFA